MYRRHPRCRSLLPVLPALVAAAALLAGCIQGALTGAAETSSGAETGLPASTAAQTISVPAETTILGVPSVDAGEIVVSGTGVVDPELASRLDAELVRWREATRVPGVVAAIRLPDGAVWTGASGRSEAGSHKPRATADTPWVIGSITKTFVAALALKLQEEGRLSLDDPISTWLPDYPNGDAITLRMLLNHTSGIADFFWHPDYESLVFGRPNHVWMVEEILALAAELKPLFRPGAKYSYSNTNYVLAGQILRMVGGEKLSRQLRTRFFDPLGLTRTVFQGEEEVPTGAAKGYLREGRTWIDISDGTNLRPNTSAATVVWSAGAIISTATDLLRWEGALYGGEVLSPESMAQLLDFGRAGYGLGTRYQRLAGRDGLGHGGSLRGFVAVMYRLPDPGIDIVVLTNRGRVDTLVGVLADSLTTITLDHLPIPTGPPLPSAAPLPSATPLPSASPIA